MIYIVTTHFMLLGLKKIKLHLNEFTTRESSDSLRVYVGISTSSYNHKTIYRGYNGEYDDYTVTYSSDFLYLHWSTNAAMNQKGFEGYVEREG